MASKRILLPILDPSIPTIQSKPISSTHLGTAYELITLSLLSSPPYDYTLVRVGGANDKGIDLRGRCTLPPPPSSSISPKSSLNSFRSLDVLVQCKSSSTLVRPAIIREFEGVLQNVSHQSSLRRPMGILVALNGFSKETLNRGLESQWPLSLVHFKVARERLQLDEHGTNLPKFEGIRGEEGEVIGWYRNQAWKDMMGDETR
ncbi:hypothetical protein JCM5353_004809 [Sporobolomyces roseus]